MQNITRPWDASGNLIPGTTVRQYIQYLKSIEFSGNVTIDSTYYNLHNLLIAPPDELDLDAAITAFDYGYYGNPGILTK